jgi:hypothetical protein
MNRFPKDKSQKREITVKIREKIEEINNRILLFAEEKLVSSGGTFIVNFSCDIFSPPVPEILCLAVTSQE